MSKYMTPEDATLAGNYTEFMEEEEARNLDEYELECDLCGAELFDNYCDDCEEYID